jgi:SEC-C motif-containing protein
MYPGFVYRENNAPNDFLGLVKGIIHELDLDDSTVFPAPIQTFYRWVKIIGARRALIELERTAKGSGLNSHEVQTLYMNHLGRVVFDRMTKEQQELYFPYNDVLVIPCGKSILVKFSSLCKIKQGGYVFYCSRRRPKLAVSSQEKVVAFTQHAIEQTCKRIYPSWLDYDGLGDVHAFFADCVYFESCTLYPDQPALTFYEDCYLADYHPRSLNFANEYFNQLIGPYPDYGKGEHWYFRVGYCPTVVNGDFVVAKTLLFPGFMKTPEYGLMLNSSLSESEKRRMKRMATDDSHTAEYMQKTFDFSTIKWFHDNGVAQVMSLGADVFAPPLEDDDYSCVYEAEQASISQATSGKQHAGAPLEMRGTERAISNLLRNADNDGSPVDTLRSYDDSTQSYCDAMERSQKRPGRNSQCPCGSQKKYKNCCLRKEKQ